MLPCQYSSQCSKYGAGWLAVCISKLARLMSSSSS